MRKVLFASTLLALVGVSIPAGAAEPQREVMVGGMLQRSRDGIQAAFQRQSEPEPSPGPTAPSTSDDDAAGIGQLITILQSDPKASHRRWAADKLEEYRWQDHPEIVAALLGAMQSDADPSVRKEAIESLKDMRACAPEVLAAMQFSAEADNDKWVRSQARSAAKKLHECQPPVLSYVSGYGPSKIRESGPQVTPDLEPTPAGPGPEPMPMPIPNGKPAEAKRGPVRSAISTAVSWFRSRF